MAVNDSPADNSTAPATPRTVVAYLVTDTVSSKHVRTFEEYGALCECAESTIHRVRP